MNENEKTKLWGLIESINYLWTNGQAEHLGPFFDENVIHVDQDYQTLTTSKEELLKSYKSFCDNAIINSFSESEEKIEIFGTTAVVSYSWNIQYEMNANSYDEKGKEILVLSKETGKWLIVWRMLVPEKQDKS
ncbi:nuclear transport factor 2 family protein [Bacteroidota bacterium]